MDYLHQYMVVYYLNEANEIKEIQYKWSVKYNIFPSLKKSETIG